MFKTNFFLALHIYMRLDKAIDTPVHRKECHSCSLPAAGPSGGTREMGIKPRSAMVPEDSGEHVGTRRGCCTSHPASSTCGGSFNSALWTSLTFHLGLGPKSC